MLSTNVDAGHSPLTVDFLQLALDSRAVTHSVKLVCLVSNRRALKQALGIDAVGAVGLRVNKHRVCCDISHNFLVK